MKEISLKSLAEIVNTELNRIAREEQREQDLFAEVSEPFLGVTIGVWILDGRPMWPHAIAYYMSPDTVCVRSYVPELNEATKRIAQQIETHLSASVLYVPEYPINRTRRSEPSE